VNIVKKLRTYITKVGFNIGGLLAAFALAIGVASTQAICIIIFHQPKVPQGMERFKK